MVKKDFIVFLYLGIVNLFSLFYIFNFKDSLLSQKVIPWERDLFYFLNNIGGAPAGFIASFFLKLQFNYSLSPLFACLVLYTIILVLRYFFKDGLSNPLQIIISVIFLLYFLLINIIGFIYLFYIKDALDSIAIENMMHILGLGGYLPGIFLCVLPNFTGNTFLIANIILTIIGHRFLINTKARHI